MPVTLRSEGVCFVDAVKLAAAFHFRLEHAALFETVKFDADAVGIFFQLFRKTLEVPAQVLVDKEAQEQLQAGFGGNKWS